MKYILFAAILLASCKNNSAADAKMAVVIPKGVVPKVPLAGAYKGRYGINDEPQPEYTFWLPDDMYGYITTFKPDGRFTSAYSADCGNDCFPYCAGRYAWVDAEHICMVANSIRITGECDNTEYTPHKDLGLYRVAKQENGILLTKEAKK